MARVTHGARVAVAFVAFAALGACKSVRRELGEVYDSPYAPPPGTLEAATFDGADADRPQVAMRLERVADGFAQPTDIQFVPGHPDVMVVLEKTGKALWVDLRTGERGTLLDLAVVIVSEQGLLGLAFHPRFAENGLFYVNSTPKGLRPEASRVDEWKVGDLHAGGAVQTRVLMEVVQPYQNHNAGQLAFGPDGMLYIGWGDGGFRADPHDHGQDATTLLGSMLRIDVDSADRPYGVPADNPFRDQPLVPPETWAIGLRNPWRYSFAPDGRLVIADVGQDAWEEISVALPGDNLGWNVREGRACFPPGRTCTSEGFREPVYVYGRDEGTSVTGGYVAGSTTVPGLAGRYVFGDFVSGRLWAIALPEGEPGTEPIPTPAALGRWPILPSAFGRDERGDLYVADFGAGAVYRLAPAQGPGAASDGP